MLRGAILSTLLLVAGCGFQPMHAGGQQGGTTYAEAHGIRVQPLRDRVGQLVHTALVERLNPQGQPRDPAYLLEVSISERTRKTGFRKDETATRANLELGANYVLREAESQQVVGQGSARSINSANILDQPYGTTVAQRDARERGAADIAGQIARDVMSQLATR